MDEGYAEDHVKGLEDNARDRSTRRGTRGPRARLDEKRKEDRRFATNDSLSLRARTKCWRAAVDDEVEERGAQGASNQRGPVTAGVVADTAPRRSIATRP